MVEKVGTVYSSLKKICAKFLQQLRGLESWFYYGRLITASWLRRGRFRDALWLFHGCVIVGLWTLNGCVEVGFWVLYGCVMLNSMSVLQVRNGCSMESS